MNDHVVELLLAIALVDDAIALAEAALLNNPSTEEERALRRNLLRLRAERAVLEAELGAALDADTEVQAPSRAQLAQIAALSDEVEAATNAAVAASLAVALTARVLDLSVAVVTNDAVTTAP
jgi:hypothetical protein